MFFNSFEMNNFNLKLNQNHCLKNINLKIKKKEKIAIIGPSGSGKSLLLESIILARIPSSGLIKVNNVDVWKKRNINNYRKLYSFSPQSISIPSKQTVLNSVQAAYINNWSVFKTFLSLFIPFKIAEIRKILKELKLEDKLFNEIELLSGGEKQCVSLCRLLLSKSNIMVSDEPVNSLDPKRAIFVIKIIIKYQTQSSSTLICSLHQPEIAKRFFDRIIGIRNGEIVFDCKSKILSENEIYALYK